MIPYIILMTEDSSVFCVFNTDMDFREAYLFIFLFIKNLNAVC